MVVGQIIATAGEGRFHAGEFAIHRLLRLGEVPLADGGPIVGRAGQLRAGRIRSRPRTEVVLEVDPRIPRAAAQGARRLEAGVHHAVFAAGIAAAPALIDPEAVPLHVGEHLGVGRVVTLGHHVARGLPSADVVGRHRPGAAGQLALARQELQITRSPEDGEHLTPTLDVLELLTGHLAGQEELGGVFAQALDHVLLGRVVIVARRNGVAVDPQRAQELEHLLEFGRFGLLVDGGVGGDLIAEDLGHLDGRHALLEDAFAFDDEIVGEFQAVDVDVPVVPLAGANHHLGLGGRVGLADDLGLLVGDQLLGEQLRQLGLEGGRVGAGQILPHLLAHEDAVGADVHQTSLFMQTGHEFLDLRIDQGLAAADGDHGRVALGRGGQALLERHHVFERRGILADAAAAGAGEVAGVQRLELEHHRELAGAFELMFDDVPGDLGRRREGKTHG